MKKTIYRCFIILIKCNLLEKKIKQSKLNVILFKDKRKY